jgi:hypothetical protein
MVVADRGLGTEVTRTCRPVGNLLLPGTPVHCAIIVWHWEIDPCRKKRKKRIDAQYTVSYGNSFPLPQGSADPTYKDDTDAFNDPGWNPFVQNYEVPVPPGMSPAQFDEAVQKSGNGYSQGPYNLLGPNSNTAAHNSVRGAGGSLPQHPLAVGQPPSNGGASGSW